MNNNDNARKFRQLYGDPIAIILDNLPVTNDEWNSIISEPYF